MPNDIRHRLPAPDIRRWRSESQEDRTAEMKEGTAVARYERAAGA